MYYHLGHVGELKRAGNIQNDVATGHRGCTRKVMEGGSSQIRPAVAQTEFGGADVESTAVIRSDVSDVEGHIAPLAWARGWGLGVIMIVYEAANQRADIENALREGGNGR